MNIALAAGLAAASVLTALAVPRAGALRVRALTPRASPRAAVALTPRLVALGVPLLVLVLLGPVAAVVSAVASLLGRRWVAGRRRDRLDALERATGIEACAALAGELRAGRVPADALAAAAAVASGRCGASLTAAAAAARMGGDVAAVLATTDGSAVAGLLRALAACWSVCATSGAGLADAVERLEEGLRAEQAQRRAVAAELAGPRATAALLAVLPAFGLLLAAGLGADPVDVLLHTQVGVLCLVAGLGLDGLGVLWTNHLVRRAGGAA